MSDCSECERNGFDEQSYIDGIDTMADDVIVLIGKERSILENELAKIKGKEAFKRLTQGINALNNIEKAIRKK